MTAIEIARSFTLFDAAEREMEAFISATVNPDDLSGQRRAGHAWIDVFESQDLPDGDFETFFRKVTIMAIIRLEEPQARSKVKSSCPRSFRWLDRSNGRKVKAV